MQHRFKNVIRACAYFTVCDHVKLVTDAIKTVLFCCISFQDIFN